MSLKSTVLYPALIAMLPAGAMAQGYAPGDRQQLFQGALPGADGTDIAIQRVTFPEGWSGQTHTHAGPVFVYVLDGAFEVEVEGREMQTLSAGDLVAEPQDVAMTARNATSAEPVTILLIQVSEEGRPLMELVDN